MTDNKFENVHELLSYLQRTLCVPKSRINNFGGYSYRNAEDILEAVKPLLPEGATLVCSDELQIGHNANYIYSTATLSYQNSVLQSSSIAREVVEKKKFDSSQLTGAASSYARKYALNGLFLLDDVQDSDVTNINDQIQKEQNANDSKIRGKVERWHDQIIERMQECHAPSDLQELNAKASQHVSEIMKYDDLSKSYNDAFNERMSKILQPITAE